MRYSFSEKIFGPDFCVDIQNQVSLLIKAGSSFTMVGIPFVGISPFFRFLATTNSSYCVYVDIHELQHRRKEALFFLLYKELGGKNKELSPLNSFELCKNQLLKLIQSEEKIVIMLNRFDHLEGEIDNNILTNLKSLEDLAQGKIVFIIASSKQLYKINEAAFYESNQSFLSKTVYFPPLSKKDLKKVLLISPVELKSREEDLKAALSLSGGHVTLLQLLLKTDYLKNPLNDPLVRLHLKVMYETCLSQQQNQLQKIAKGKKLNMVDLELLNIGMVIKVGDHYEIFSPLFSEYILSYAKLTLPRKERKLFHLLKKNLGKVVKKEEIFKNVWEKDADNASDWALNALIYRLRKNFMFKNSRYIIASDKNTGYKLVKESDSLSDYMVTNKLSIKKSTIYTIATNCPDVHQTIKRIIDVASQSGAGRKGRFSRVAMIIRGEETWIAGERTKHFIGIPNTISVAPTVRIIMQCYKEDLKNVVSEIVKVHPYEEPVIEVTKLENQSIYPAKNDSEKYNKQSLASCLHCLKYPIIKNKTNHNLLTPHI